jgi:dimethylamine monooxygenase subunit A
MIILPEPNPPFMNEARFEIKADLFPLGTVINGKLEQKHFEQDNQLESFLTERLKLFETQLEKRRMIHTDDEPGLAESLHRVFGLYAKDHPELIHLEPDGIELKYLGLKLRCSSAETRIEPVIERPAPTDLGERIATWLERQSGVARMLDALALSCQEDIVIMRGAADTAHAEALSVSFPSGWDPREKLAENFERIHEPIADNAKLLKASGNTMKALLTKGPFIRFSWGLTINPSLDNHPQSPKPEPLQSWLENPSELVKHSYLRMERQTTYPMPELERGLFSIRVYVTPLLERLERDPSLRSRLARFVASVKPEVLAYKGQAKITPGILQWLQSEEQA